MTAAALALALLAAAPASAQVCKGVTCFDGFNGCPCNDGGRCCKARWDAKNGASGGGRGAAASGGGYSSYALEMYGKSLSAMGSYMSAAAEQKRAAEALERQRAAEAAAMRRAEEDARRAELASGFKDQAPDLGAAPGFKSDEPAPKAKPADPRARDKDCRHNLPHLARGQTESAASFAVEERDYVARAAEWERACGTKTASGAIVRAKSTKVAAYLAYESRVSALLARSPTSLDDDAAEEMNALREESHRLRARMTNAEHLERLELMIAKGHVPPPVTDAAVKAGTGDLSRWGSTASKKRVEEPSTMKKAADVLDSMRHPTRGWTKLRDAWERKKGDLQENGRRLVREVIGSGVINTQEWGQ